MSLYPIAADGPKDIKVFSKDLKEVYCAINEEIALEKFYEVKAKWEKLSFRCSKPERNWDVITPFFKFPEKIQKIFYTTNIIEALHRQELAPNCSEI